MKKIISFLIGSILIVYGIIAALVLADKVNLGAVNAKPSDTMYKFADIARDNMVKAVNNGKQVSDMLTAAGNDVAKLFTNRVKDVMDDIKKSCK